MLAPPASRGTGLGFGLAIGCDVAEAQHQRERRALAVGRALCRQFRVSRSSEECKRYHLTFGVMQTGWRVSRIN